MKILFILGITIIVIKISNTYFTFLQIYSSSQLVFIIPRNIRSLLPNENIIYIGDNYHCPYGDKTPEQLFEYASGIVEYFIEQNVKLIVLACNTTSSTVLESLQVAYPQITNRIMSTS